MPDELAREKEGADGSRTNNVRCEHDTTASSEVQAKQAEARRKEAASSSQVLTMVGKEFAMQRPHTNSSAMFAVPEEGLSSI